MKAPKKDKKDEDEDDKAFKAKQKAEAAALKDAQARASKAGPMGGGGIKKPSRPALARATKNITTGSNNFCIQVGPRECLRERFGSVRKNDSSTHTSKTIGLTNEEADRVLYVIHIQWGMVDA
ncbi:hypothetical protein RHS04_09621 [Rhizoctonia solani]|uniref:Uncharacterized protein n=1 Tax=Rhizoctonia solani TaxID=456999 RepID=A0A8H7LI54_9AGAM|nr:hypothetical protein RHS04_09621 [Rhizoctonia solani]